MRELVERAQRGDLEAFGRLVGRFQDAVFGTAYSLLGDFHKAQDIAQESFIRAWRNLEGLREPGSFPGWLFRITRNCCLDFLRRRNPDPLPLSGVEMPASDVPPAPKELADAEMRGAVLDAIRSLSEPHRLATTLFYIDGYSVREVAEFLDVPAGTVKSRLHDARNKLRERMVAMVEDELKGSRPGPEFRDRLMRQIARVEVRPQQSPDDRGLVLLVDENDRCLPMLIGKAEELAIHRAVSGQESPRPLTHELLA
ncbi:MAG: sigma-70 family RNA polymerase sigma factor, partial [Gemmatimonadales bacterium]|nr:sigma-70 family RNA polymerase sigma factor [Gemmatimonadales bacterium]